MTIKDCPTCGGTHYGSVKCPYTSAACVVCGEATVFACSDCAIDGEKSVHVCEKPACRDAHEAAQHPAKPEAVIAFDDRCLDLARHFNPNYTTDRTTELAAAIQEAVDDWFFGRCPKCGSKEYHHHHATFAVPECYACAECGHAE